MREYGTVIVEHLHLRDAPNGKIIGWLRREDDFEVTGAFEDQEENRWLPVKIISTGMYGWLAQKRHDGTQTYVSLWRVPDEEPRDPRPWIVFVIVTLIGIALIILPHILSNN